MIAVRIHKKIHAKNNTAYCSKTKINCLFPQTLSFFSPRQETLRKS